MVFSSLPAYLDPSNWQQPGINQIGSDPRHSSQLLHPEPPLPPPHQNTHGGATSSSVRPGSMSERARLANIPLPEASLKCPRCESTNTKFCYFNNYSLTQPRHFCKTCRRYWTRGGALRSVPVGGGCRRNKKKKGSSSKSPISSERQTSGGGSSSMIPSSSEQTDIPSLGSHMPTLRFMDPLHNLNEFSSGEVAINYGHNYSAVSAPMRELNFHPGVAPGSGGAAAALLGLDQQWRIQQTPQFPFLSSYDPSSSAMFERRSSFPVKIEETQQDQGLNLGRQFLGSVEGNEDYWNGTNPWSDLSGFISSSTTSNPP